MVDRELPHGPHDLTSRLNAGAGAPAGAGGDLPARVYRQLKQMAHRELRREHADRTLCTTALVHEAWMKIGVDGHWKDRKQFYRHAATSMRHILVDEARKRLAGKRGAGARHVTLVTADATVADAAQDILGVDAALQELRQLHCELAEVVELRFFAGLSVQETAAVLEVTERTVVRRWRTARAMIHRSLETDHVA